MNNLYENIPRDIPEEIFGTIFEKSGVRVERIISKGQATPPGEWLSQDKNEWVILLEGGAEISFEGEGGSQSMRPGDHLLIEPGKRHRVESTLSDKVTIWLAVYF